MSLRTVDITIFLFIAHIMLLVISGTVILGIQQTNDERLLWDLKAAIPTVISIIFGIIAIILNRKSLNKIGISQEHAQKLRNDKRIYHFYLYNTIVFFVTYLGLIYFPCSLALQAIIAFLLLIAVLLFLTSWSNKIAFPGRYSSYPILLFLGGSTGLVMTCVLWWLLHWLDWSC